MSPVAKGIIMGLRVKMFWRTISVALGMAVVVAAGTFTPAYADGITCGVLCTHVRGTGLHVNSITLQINSASVKSATGHIQVRWRQGGADHSVNGPNNTVLSSLFETGLNLNVNVDQNSLVCARFWVRNSNGTFTLYAGQDYSCITAHS
jgi:hypothetical protein